MKTSLTPSQRAQLEALLQARQRELEARLRADLGAQARAEQARGERLGAAEDASESDAEREVDVAQAEFERRELGAVKAALQRMREPEYGRCADCGAAIPFGRLQVEPWAVRCVPCQEAIERRG